MLRNLILPLSIYRLHLKIHAIESRVKEMESKNYLDLCQRKEIAQMKKMLATLHEHEAALHFSLSM